MSLFSSQLEVIYANTTRDKTMQNFNDLKSQNHARWLSTMLIWCLPGTAWWLSVSKGNLVFICVQKTKPNMVSHPCANAQFWPMCCDICTDCDSDRRIKKNSRVWVCHLFSAMISCDSYEHFKLVHCNARITGNETLVYITNQKSIQPPAWDKILATMHKAISVFPLYEWHVVCCKEQASYFARLFLFFCFQFSSKTTNKWTLHWFLILFELRQSCWLPRSCIQLAPIASRFANNALESTTSRF